ncbi:hypothetical protein [Pseudomonas phage PIP]|nr:hypothetical protein [Pseudomonas phage PIP]
MVASTASVMEDWRQVVPGLGKPVVLSRARQVPPVGRGGWVCSGRWISAVIHAMDLDYSPTASGCHRDQQVRGVAA